MDIRSQQGVQFRLTNENLIVIMYRAYPNRMQLLNNFMLQAS